jgi:hypothetical protein
MEEKEEEVKSHSEVVETISPNNLPRSSLELTQEPSKQVTSPRPLELEDSKEIEQLPPKAETQLNSLEDESAVQQT